MSPMKKLSLALVFSLLAVGSISCAASLCERKHNFMSSTCSGGDVTYSPDVLCEEKVKRCNEGQLAQFRAYVSCLESAGICSLDVISKCAEAHPGGVNLAC